MFSVDPQKYILFVVLNNKKLEQHASEMALAVLEPYPTPAYPFNPDKTP